MLSIMKYSGSGILPAAHEPPKPVVSNQHIRPNCKPKIALTVEMRKYSYVRLRLIFIQGGSTLGVDWAQRGDPESESVTREGVAAEVSNRGA